MIIPKTLIDLGKLRFMLRSELEKISKELDSINKELPAAEKLAGMRVSYEIVKGYLKTCQKYGSSGNPR